MKKGRKLIQTIFNSVVSPEDTVHFAEVSAPHGYRIDWLNFYWLGDGIVAGQSIKSSAGFHVGTPKTAIKNKQEVRQTLSYEDKNGFSKNINFAMGLGIQKGESMLVFDEGIGGKNEGEGFYMVLRKPIEEVCANADRAFSKGLLPTVTYFIETSLMRFEFPHIRGFHGHGGISEQGCVSIEAPSKYSTKDREIMDYSAPLFNKLRSASEGLEKTVKVNEALMEHSREIEELTGYYVELHEDLTSTAESLA